MKILILEDNRERIAAFEAAVAGLPDTQLVVWRSAHEMEVELDAQLPSASLVSLDHDLVQDEGDPDPGDGLQIAEAVAKHMPVCSVIVHSTNIDRVYSMIRELEDGGWRTVRVAPFGEASEWIPAVWLPEAQRLLGEEASAGRTAKHLRKLNDPTADLTDVFPDLADIIAVNTMTNFTPFDPDLEQEKLSEVELEQVKQELMAYIDDHEFDNAVSSAFWCLGKFFDDDLKEYFQSRLARYCKKADDCLAAVGQIEICLSNLGEDIISNDSFSAADHTKNMNDVRDYLEVIRKLNS